MTKSPLIVLIPFSSKINSLSLINLAIQYSIAAVGSHRKLQNSKNNIALLLFSRSIEKEAAAKQFIEKQSKYTNQQIARSLYNKTRSTVAQAGVDIIESDQSNQQGNSFGEKLANQIDKVFSAGYEKLIIVGTDCPSLSEQHIKYASNILKSSHETVIGPAEDGGAYLIGITKSNYQRSAFIELSWQTKDLLHQLTAHYNEPFLLQELSDIDHAEDLRAYLKSGSNLFIKLILKLIDHLSPKMTEQTVNYPQIDQFNTIFFRGPPLFH